MGFKALSWSVLCERDDAAGINHDCYDEMGWESFEAAFSLAAALLVFSLFPWHVYCNIHFENGLKSIVYCFRYDIESMIFINILFRTSLMPCSDASCPSYVFTYEMQ